MLVASCCLSARRLLRRLPEGQTPKSLQRDLNPTELRVSEDGRLYHIFVSKPTGRRSSSDPYSNSGGQDIHRLLGLIEPQTAHRIFEELPIHIDSDPNQDDDQNPDGCSKYTYTVPLDDEGVVTLLPPSFV